jgi:two-component system chemotaxis sensor kinase CheA
MVDFDRSAFIGKFQEEAADLLQRLNEGFIALETASDDRELSDRVLRDAHTLKGSSRMVGLIEISDIAHRLEDVMMQVRAGLTYTPEMSDSIFEALDAVAFLTEHAAEKEPAHDLDLAGLQSRLESLAASGTTPGDAAADATTEAPAPETPPASSDQECVAREDDLRSKEQPTVRVRTSDVDGLLNLASEVVISEVRDVQRVDELHAVAGSLSGASQTWAKVKTALGSIGEADGLADLLGEDMGTLDRHLTQGRRDLADFVSRYSEESSRSSMIANELQDEVMQLRMLPVSTIFQVFPRAIRDLAREYGKEIELVLEGEETELDKKVLEAINDPLVHIMRNAVDHGIELPEERVAAGKPARGTVRLAARQEGDHIVIEIADDGAGIDPVKVRRAAVRKGYVSPADAEQMTDREAMFLIFEPGFSTSAIITEISGRGVGMDVVREFVVGQLKGSLDVHSNVGRGTTFQLVIPLTLAVIRALMLRVDGQLFALPTASVDETLRVERSEVVKLEGRDVIRRGRRTIPLVHLTDVLGIHSAEEIGRTVTVASVGYSGHRIGYIVDEFVGEQQIVIKPLGSHLGRVDNIAGVTVAGAGEIVPILNVPDLIKNARSLSGKRLPAARGEMYEKPERQRLVLICEDSFTTRELERSIFESAGWKVEAAPDGAAGLARLQEGLAVDAVVTDVQMPNMTGLELTRAIKGDAALRATPVVVVTSLERDEEKAEGIAAGADAYITKSVFNQDTLLDTVESLVR